MESTGKHFVPVTKIKITKSGVWPLEGEIIATGKKVHMLPLWKYSQFKNIKYDKSGSYIDDELFTLLTTKYRGFQNVIGLGNCNDEESIYIVLEPMQGIPLQNYCRLLAYREKAIPKSLWLDLVVIISRFQKLFARPHGSINPKDIFVTEDGKCVIGFPERIYWTREKSEATEYGEMYDLYMSPKQKCGEDNSFSVDVFAICTVFYYILNNCNDPPRRKIFNSFTFKEETLDVSIRPKILNSDLYKLVKSILLERTHVDDIQWLFDIFQQST